MDECTCWRVQYSSAVAVIGQTERNPECPVHGDPPTEEKLRRFTCAVCKGEYVSDPEMTQEDRVAEFEQIHGKPYDAAKVSSVCDDCFPKVIAWARERGLLP